MLREKDKELERIRAQMESGEVGTAITVAGGDLELRRKVRHLPRGWRLQDLSSAGGSLKLRREVSCMGCWIGEPKLPVAILTRTYCPVA